MSDYTPPIEDLPIFDSIVFLSGETYLTQNVADKRYLRYPNAQGTENLQTINVNGIATFNNSSNFNKPITMTSATATDRVINSSTYELKDRTTNVTGGSIFADGGNFRYDNDSNGSSHQFYNDTTGGTQVNTLTLNTTNLTISTTAPPTLPLAVMPGPTDSTTKIPSTAWVQSALSNAISFTPRFWNFANYQTGTTGFSQGPNINWSAGWGVRDYIIIRVTSQVNWNIVSGEYNDYATTSGELIIRPFYAPAGVFGSLSPPNIFYSVNSGTICGNIKKLIYYTGASNNGSQSLFFAYGNGGAGSGGSGSIQLMCDSPGTAGGWQYTSTYEYIIHTVSGATITFANGTGTNNSLP